MDAAADFVRSHASLHTFMTDRIDRLRPSHQLTLKARTARRYLHRIDSDDDD